MQHTHRSGNNRVCVLTKLRKCENPHSEDALQPAEQHPGVGNQNVGEIHHYLHTYVEPSKQRKESRFIAYIHKEREMCYAWCVVLEEYLETCALVGERRAKETCDNAHDCLGYITLQRGIRMLPVAGVVAHLDEGREDINVTHSHWITLPACGRQRRHCMLRYLNCPSLWYNMRQKSVFHALITLSASFQDVTQNVASPCICPPGSSRKASTYGWRCKSPSSPPLCQHSSDLGSWCRQSSPENTKRHTHHWSVQSSTDTIN